MRALRSKPSGLKLGVVGLVLLVLGVAWHLGVFARMGNPGQLAQALVALDGWGYLGFIVAYTVLQPFGVPGTIFIVAAPLIWPWPIAFALSMTGTMAASVVGFAFARFIARDWVAARIPARWHKYDEALERSAFTTVMTLRLVFWMPQVLHAFFGVSKVRFWTHFWGSLVGYVPPLLLVSYLGAAMFDASGHLQPGAWRVMAALVLVLLALTLLAWKLQTWSQARHAAAGDAPRRHTDG